MDQPLRPNEFRCEVCGGVFVFGWTDQAAIEELARNFNEPPRDDDAILCDDCYKVFINKIFN